MGDGQRNGSRLDAVALEEAAGHIARLVVALRHGHLDDVQLLGPEEFAVFIQGNVRDRLLGDHSAGLDLDGVDPAALQVHFQLLLRKVLDAHAALHRVDGTALHRQQVLPLLGGQHTLNPHPVHMELGQVVQQHDVRPVAGSDGPPVVQPEALGGVEGGHAQGGGGVQALLHADAQVAVQVALLQDGSGLAVVRAEQTPPAVGRGDPLEQGAQVVTGGALAEEHVHTQS